MSRWERLDTPRAIATLIAAMLAERATMAEVIGSSRRSTRRRMPRKNPKRACVRRSTGYKKSQQWQPALDAVRSLVEVERDVFRTAKALIEAAAICRDKLCDADDATMARRSMIRRSERDESLSDSVC
jgi:hypothetical protein